MPVKWLQEDYQGEETYEGFVLKVYVPDFKGRLRTTVALVWDEVAKQPFELEVEQVYLTVNGSVEDTQKFAEVTVDAPPHVREQCEAYKALEAEKKKCRYLEAEAMDLSRGKEVKVHLGDRKVKVGTHGRIIWKGKCKYDEERTRVGILTDEGQKHFVYIEQVALIDWRDYLPRYYRPICQNCGRKGRDRKDLEIQYGICIHCREEG